MKDVGNEGHFHPVRSVGTCEIIGLLKACDKQEDLVKGSKLHAYIQEHKFLEKSCYIASALVSMYARCGALPKAQQVLNELPVRDEVTWTAMIAGYAQHGQGEEALNCFDSMQQEGHSPDVVAFTCALKACGNIGDTGKGEEIHEKIISLGMLDKDIILGSILVEMYAKCGAIVRAKQVFEELPVRNLVTWNALIAGYAQWEQGGEALKCFNSMQAEGYTPDAITFTCALKACRNVGVGEQIHEKVVGLGMLEKDVMLGSTLVDMYAKCGALEKAQQVLQGLPVRDVITWTAMIVGYTQQGQAKQALYCFDHMQQEGHSPEVVTFICALKACGSLGAAAKGEQIHRNIVRLGYLNKNIVLGGTLVDMYASCGLLTKAQQLLKELPVQNVVMWNAVMTGYIQQGQDEEALKCYNCMQCDGHSPTAVTLICALKACGHIGATGKGEHIHEKIVQLGMLENDVMLGSTLVDMYARCGALAKAQHILSELPMRTVVTWNALIVGYAKQGQAKEALVCFDSMQRDGHYPDAITFLCGLKSCGSIGSVIKVEQIHEKIIKLGILEKDVILGSTLVDMYVKCGAFKKAQQVLYELPARNMVMWNALITGYAQCGQAEEALECFDRMQQEGHFPNAVTFISSLKACGRRGAVSKGKEIHDKIVSLGMLEGDIVLGNSLVYMYARCGALAKAQQVLNKLLVWDIVTWNTLIAGYTQQGRGEAALKCFDNMQHEGHIPNKVTFICILKACGSIEAVAKGEKIHDKLVKLGLLEKDIVLGNTLVDMYCKCGVVLKAVEVFQELSVQDVVTWSALIGGYAQQGQSEEALNLFESMQSKGVRPDLSTLVSVLSACSHCGLLDYAEVYFLKMKINYGLTLNVEHCGCMVDLFSRAGRLKMALMLIEQMPYSDHLPFWLALLSACRFWKEVKIGRLAFERALQLDKMGAANYVGQYLQGRFMQEDMIE